MVTLVNATAKEISPGTESNSPGTHTPLEVWLQHLKQKSVRKKKFSGCPLFLSISPLFDILISPSATHDAAIGRAIKSCPGNILRL